jgi:HEAT repeat protein
MLSRSTLSRTLGLALALAAPFASVPGRSALAQVPGREAFSSEPKTPLESWEVATYLIRIGQPDQAAPYVKKFIDFNPDDATLLQARDAYGTGSFLALSDYPETRPYAKELAGRLARASIRSATDPARMAQAIQGLTKSPEEQTVAVERLREAGPYAVPPWLQALGVSGIDPSSRSALSENLGRLDKNAVPALIAALDSSDTSVVGDVARALGRIGDARAVPALTYLAARVNPPSFARGEAIQAVQKLTGQEFGSEPKIPVRVLSDLARSYHNHAIRFPTDPVVLWLWNPADKVPAPVQLSVRDAEGFLGLRAAREALEIDPTDVEAKVVQIGLGLDHDPANWKASALASGGEILGKVLRRAVAERRFDLAVVVSPILGELANRNDLLVKDRPNALVDALLSPDRRVQFAAAATLIDIDPRKPFPGSSQVVPVLARFLASRTTSRALVIDGNAERASQVTGFLRNLGLDARTAPTGAEGFTDAAESADIELIVIDPNSINDPWDVTQTLANLGADARTASLPVFLVGPLDLRNRLGSKLESFPNAQFLVTPTETRLLKDQIERGLVAAGARPLSADERSSFAKRAAALLARIARSPGSPFEYGLPRAEPGLALALNGPIAAAEAAEALGDIPGVDAQRSLADVALDPSKDVKVRVVAARQLARNIRRFTPRLASSQEASLVAELGQEADPTLREALAAVAGALKPVPDASASLLPTYSPAPIPATSEPSPKPVTPGPATP